MTNKENFDLSKTFGNLVSSQQSQVAGPVQGFVEVVQAWQQYLRIKETEKTKRVEIRAHAQVEITNIREKTQLLRDYFVMAFAERRENFDRCFQLLDAGLNSGNDKQIDTALSLIVTVIKESPLKQAAEVMNQIRNRPEGKVIDI